MSTTFSVQPIADLKAQAKRMRAKLLEQGHAVTHSQSLETLARQLGHKDWNTLFAAIGNRTPECLLVVGQRVSGHYLGQPFQANVVGLVRLQTPGFHRVTLHFDQPVDVVTFESFSAFRQRVSATVNAAGVSPEKTSNGYPQLKLDL